MWLAPGKTSIRRALVHAPESDALAWRGRFERALANADLRPPSLPSSAILCVRRLRSEVGPFRSRGEPDFSSTDAWQRRTIAALDELVRQAARPARGMVPPNALAVVFADYAELLACLALDWCRGEAVGRWWWAALFPGLAPPEAVHKAWAESPQHVPAALGRLNEAGHGADHGGVFLRALPGSVVAELAANVARAFGLETLRPILTQAIDLKSAQRIAGDERGVGARTLVLAPGCKTGEMAAKRWPYFPQLAEAFPDVAVVGTRDDLRAHDGSPLRFPSHVRSFVDRLSLRQTAELLASAGVAVGNDSGLTHIAAAVGAPTIMLFGPTPHQSLGKFPPNVRVLRRGLACEPCWFQAPFRACAGRLDCLAHLSVGTVIEAVHRLGLETPDAAASLGQVAAPTHGPPQRADHGTRWPSSRK